MPLDDFIIPTITELNHPIAKAFKKAASLAEIKSYELESALGAHLRQKSPTFSAVEKYNVQIIRCYSRGYSLTSAQDTLAYMLPSHELKIDSLVSENKKLVKKFRGLFDQALLQTAVMDTYKEEPHFIFIEVMQDATDFGEEPLFRRLTKEERDEIITYRNAMFTKDMPNIDGLRYTATRLKGDSGFQNKLFVSTFCRNYDELEAMLEMRSEFCPDDFLKTSALLDTLDIMRNIYCNCSGIGRKGRNVREDDDSAVY
jgi:hypothetical protein